LSLRNLASLNLIVKRHWPQSVDWFLYCFKNFARFSGRASRAEYWWFYAISTGVDIVLRVAEPHAHHVASILEIAWGCVAFIPRFSVTSRRLHDCGHSFWWGGALVIGMLIFVVANKLVTDLLPTAGEGAFVKILYILFILGLLALVLCVLYFLCKRGEPGENKYGRPAPTSPA
jgi:uncharacterized membrane protein YhaH (DUF805 family)